MKQLLVVLMLTALTSASADAAFRWQPLKRMANGAPVSGFHKLYSPSDKTSADRGRNDKAGIISLVCGLAGVAIAAVFLEVIVDAAVLAAIGFAAAGALSFVFGLTGIKRKPRWFTIAGFGLGVVEMAIIAIMMTFLPIVLLIIL